MTLLPRFVPAARFDTLATYLILKNKQVLFFKVLASSIMFLFNLIWRVFNIVSLLFQMSSKVNLFAEVI